MLIQSYVLACALAASVTHTRVAATGGTGEFCHGWTDKRNHRREGFYCPEKDDRSSAVICCGRCEYRYCCSDATTRLDQGTCSDTDPDRKLPSKAEVVADEFSSGDYPVYVPFLIVGSAFLALLLFGGSACFLYSRQSSSSGQSSSSESAAVGTTVTTCSTTTTSAMTTTAPCGSSSSLCPHGDRSHGEQPRCRGDSCHVQRPCRDGRPGDTEHPVAIETRHLVAQQQQQPRPPCILCSVQQHHQRAPSPPANHNASQHACPRPLTSPANQITSHGYSLPPPLPHPPTLMMSPQSHPLSAPFPVLPHHFHTHPLSNTTSSLNPSHSNATPSLSPSHFHTHPLNSSHSKAASSAQYATMPHPGSTPQDRPTPIAPLGSLGPLLKFAQQQLPLGSPIPASLLPLATPIPASLLPLATPIPASLLRSHAHLTNTSPGHSHIQYRIPSPPPSLTLTHHPLL